MNYNLKVEMERINGKVVSNVEVSGIGRAGRKRITSPDFAAALNDVKAVHDELLASFEAYHHQPDAPPPAAKQPTAPSKGKAPATA